MARMEEAVNAVGATGWAAVREKACFTEFEKGNFPQWCPQSTLTSWDAANDPFATPPDDSIETSTQAKALYLIGGAVAVGVVGYLLFS